MAGSGLNCRHGGLAPTLRLPDLFAREHVGIALILMVIALTELQAI